MDNGFGVSLDLLDSPGVHCTLRVETKTSVCSRGKKGLAVTCHSQNCSCNSYWVYFPWGNSSADLKLFVSKTNLLLWSVLDYCLLQKTVGVPVAGMVNPGESRSRYLCSGQPAA